MRYRLLSLLILILALFVASSANAQIVQTDRTVAPGYQLLTANLNLVAKAAPSPDHVFYNPVSGIIVVGITNHPQRSGFNGEVYAPGDCWADFKALPGATTFLVGDFNGDGLVREVLLYRAGDGRWVEYSIDLLTLLPGCDTTTAY